MRSPLPCGRGSFGTPPDSATATADGEPETRCESPPRTVSCWCLSGDARLVPRPPRSPLVGTPARQMPGLVLYTNEIVYTIPESVWSAAKGPSTRRNSFFANLSKTSGRVTVCAAERGGSMVPREKNVELRRQPNICLVWPQDPPVRISRPVRPYRPCGHVTAIPSPTGRGVRVVRRVPPAPVSFPPRPGVPPSPLSRLSFQRSIRPCGFVRRQARPAPTPPTFGPDDGSDRSRTPTDRDRRW
jgi:hypothetical protein